MDGVLVSSLDKVGQILISFSLHNCLFPIALHFIFGIESVGEGSAAEILDRVKIHGYQKLQVVAPILDQTRHRYRRANFTG